MSEADQTETGILETEDQVTNAHEIDWDELWEEFGFDTPDVHGNEYVSSIQLGLALEATEQNFAGDPGAVISDAVEGGILDRLTTPGEKGESTLRGYVYQVGGEQ